MKATLLLLFIVTISTNAISQILPPPIVWSDVSVVNSGFGDVAYGNGSFMTVTDNLCASLNNFAYVSTNFGTSWTQHSTPGSTDISGVAFSPTNNIFCISHRCYEQSRNYSYSLNNGTTWTPVLHAPSNYGAYRYDMLRVKDYFFSAINVNTCDRSSDGINWTHLTFNGANTSSVTCYSENFGYYYANGGTYFWTSPDATSWTQRSAMGGYKFVAGNYYVLAYISPSTLKRDGVNGLNFSETLTSLPNVTSINRMKFLNGFFWATITVTGDNSKKVMASHDGDTWTILDTPPTTCNANGIDIGFDSINHENVILVTGSGGKFLKGRYADAPITQATNLTFSNVQTNQFTFNWNNGNGSKRAVFIKQGTAGTASPDFNTTYIANTTLGLGTQIGTSGWYCVFNGSSHTSGVTVTGLNSNTNYRIQVVEYNGSSGDERYNSSSDIDNPKNQLTGSSGFSCGSAIIINHVAGVVVPVNKTTTYSTVTNIPGEPSKCWITSNLGADHQATSVDDATEPSAGWYWQFNRKQGFKHDGTTRTPNTTWITNITENSDWLTANDPCTLELGVGWRIPTGTEYLNIDANGGWSNWNGPWNSTLKLHAAGVLYPDNGFLSTRGSIGQYWSSSNANGESSWYLILTNNQCSVNGNVKALGMPLRCLKDASTSYTIPILTTFPVTNITQNTAISGGNVTSDGGTTVISRGVCWSITTSPSISDNHTTDGTGIGSFTSSISGLSANTTYYVKAYATNSVGTAYGELQTFSTPCNSIPTNGLVAWYPFNGNASDQSGNGNNGTVHGATLTTDFMGITNNAYQFNGIDNYIELQNPLPIANLFTISFWAYNQQGTGQGEILNDGSMNLGGNDFLINLNSDRIGIRADKGGNSLDYEEISPPELSNLAISNVWIHVAWVMTPENSQVYLNGTLKAQINESGTNAGYHDPTSYIGARRVWTEIDDFFEGKIDDIRIYNRNLSASEINQLYVGSNCISQPHANDVILGCNGGIATLTATGGLNYRWYSTPIGGTPIATGNTFTTPSLASTTSYYLSSYIGNYESFRDTVTVTVVPVPNVAFIGTYGPYCLYSPIVTLTTTPVGGVFYGDGLTGNQFNPSVAGVGEHSIDYYFTDEYGCTNADTITIIVNPTPSGTIPPIQQSLTNITINNGQFFCSKALQIITVAGNGTTFIVENGGIANLISGENILLLSGTSVGSGATLHASVTTDCIICSAPNKQVAETLTTEKPVNETSAGSMIKPFLTVYPNPTNGQFTLEMFGCSSSSNVIVKVYGLLGAMIKSEVLSGVTKKTFSLEGYPKGIYMVKVYQPDKISTVKVVKL